MHKPGTFIIKDCLERFTLLEASPSASSFVHDLYSPLKSFFITIVMVRPVSWAAFLLLLIVSLVLGAGLDEELFLNGELGVELDYNLAVPIDGSKDGLGLKQRNLLYSSHLTFKESVDSITPGQLFEIGKNAFNEMKASHNMYGLGKKFQPAVSDFRCLFHVIPMSHKG